MLVISFKDVTYSYPGTETPAIKNINLTIKEGEIILVTGPSGAGKTTLCSTLNRIVPEAYEGELSGEICFRGENISKYSIGKMAFKAGMLFQDPSGQLINPTVADEVAFGPENKGVPVKKIEELIDEYVGYVHMEEYLDRSPQALSGGQQQSVAYASVLAMEPEVMYSYHGDDGLGLCSLQDQRIYRQAGLGHYKAPGTGVFPVLYIEFPLCHAAGGRAGVRLPLPRK